MDQHRGDTLLRAIVDAAEAAGFVTDARDSNATASMIQVRAGEQRARITHRWRARCCIVELPARTIHRYYQVWGLADRPRIAQALTTTLQVAVAQTQ